MAEQKKKQPVFCKVDQLRPGANGLNLTVKVVSSKIIMQRGAQGRQMRLAECLVGDETGMIIFTARNDQGIWFLLHSQIIRNTFNGLNIYKISALTLLYL